LKKIPLLKKINNASKSSSKTASPVPHPLNSRRQELVSGAEGSGPTFWKNLAYASCACVFFALFAALFLWPFLIHRDWIPGTGDMICAWPYKYVWIESLKRAYPALWNPYSSLGQPFLAGSGSGPYAPFNFLFFMYPTSYAFTLSYFFHFVIAAFGTYLFIRRLATGWMGACLGGLAYAFSGYFMGKFWMGGLNIITGAAWMPLVLYGLQRFTEQRRFSALLISSAAFGFCILDGTPQIDIYVLMITGFFLVWAWMRREINWKEFWGAEAMLILLGFSLGLCQMAPTYQFSLLSNRMLWDSRDFMRDAFVPANFQFFINPFFAGDPENYHGTGGYAEVVVYVGLIPFFLALLGFVGLLKRPIVLWMGLVAVLSMALAMADTTMITHYIYLFFSKLIPGLSRNRVPSRIMVLTTFVLACSAGLTLDAWTRYWQGKKSLPGLFRAFLALVVPAFLLLGTAVDLYRFDAKHALGSGGSNFFFTDLFPPNLLKKIKDDPTYPRVQPGSTYCEYQLVQNISSVVTGCGSLFIQTTQKYMDEEYNHPETPLVDLIRLKYNYRPEGSPPSERWQPIPGAQVPVWDNSKAYPRAFMVGGYSVNPDYNQVIDDIRDEKVDPRQEVVLAREPAEKPEGQKGWVGEARITRYDYNDVEMDCSNDRPCFLFLSDSYFPGWKALVDGKEEPIYQADGTFRAVPLLNPGHHQVKMSYYPPIIVYSFFYSLFAWIALGVGWIFRKRLDQWFSSRFGGFYPLAQPVKSAADIKGRGKGRSPTRRNFSNS
jgi:hypothetical protein